MPPPGAHVPISKPKLLVGEGKDEVFFFEALIDRLGLSDIQVEEYGGKNRLSIYVRELRVRPNNHALVSVGITRDTDAAVHNDFQSICGALQAAGFNSPASPAIVGAGAPRVGVLLLPDNSSNGMLEDLCLAALQADAAAPCVVEYFKCVSQRAGRQPVESSKARMHAWLASNDPPDLRLGEAAKRKLLPWDDPAFDKLKQFLQAL